MDKAMKKYEGKPARYSQEERWKLEAWMKLNSLAATATGGNPYVNRWNERPYTGRYFEILEKRRALPVWQQKVSPLHDNQTFIHDRRRNWKRKDNSGIAQTTVQYPCAFS
jgi:hypothetical protein